MVTAKDIENERKQQEQDQNADLTVKGRFNRYNSPFLQLMIPLLTTRYVWLAIEDINPLNFLKKPDPALKPDFVMWEKPNTSGYLRRNFAALGMGATSLAVISYYSKRTYEDIRTLYAEAVGYELDKKPQDVGWKEIFSSHNKALEVTRGAFVRRTLARLAAGSAFFVPWHAARDWTKAAPKYDANANAGVGAIGTYLSLDGFMRKPSFFDAEQSMVAETINHAGEKTHETITTKNIQTLLMLQRRHLDKGYHWPSAATREGKEQAVLATRIADLLNQTYHNTDTIEEVRFTMGKFNFLIGFGMLDSFPEALAFTELANKSKDMKDVKQAASMINAGQDAQGVFQQFGVDMQQLVREHTDQHSETEPKIRYTERVQSAKARIPQAARTHQDFASPSEGVINQL